MSRTDRLHNAIHGRNRRLSLKPRLEGLEERLVLSSPGSTASIVASPIVVPKMILNGAGQLVPLDAAGPTGLDPAQLVTAYGLNQISFDGIVGNGAGQTIAIVDAYDNPSFVSSTDPNFDTSALHIFDQQFGLPDPPSFLKVNQNGQASPLPAPDAPGGWGVEISLDVEWAHSMAPDANIVLVEANDATNGNLISTAVVTAGQLGTVVSMSFGESESAGETSYDSEFVVPGVTFLASTDDTGSPGAYPAYSPNVVAVGGTTLNGLDSAGDYPGTGPNGEIGWSDGGGGISTVETEPSYQTGVQSTGFRTIPDIAADADPNTGVSVYDPYDEGSALPWTQVGGTSLACPLMAGMMAIVDQGRVYYGGSTLSSAQTHTDLYSVDSTKPSDFHDILHGNNGGFNAGPGYDEVTGLGSPNGSQLVPDLSTFGLFVNVASIAITPSNPSVAKGLAEQFTATVKFKNGKVLNLTDAVSWVSSTLTVATISATGQASTLAQGSTVITASLSGVTSPGDTLTVTPAVLTSIDVTPASPSLAKGLSQQFIATGIYTDSSAADLTSQVTWASATPTVASISGTGFAQTLAIGTTNITATLGSLISPIDTLTVTPAALLSIALSPLDPSIVKRLSLQLTAIGTYTDGTTNDLTSLVKWVSGTPAFGRISVTGLVSALQVGSAAITASLSGITNTADTVTVLAPVLTSLTLTPAGPSVPKGLAEQITATGNYSDGSSADLSSQVTWTSAKPAVASISSTGLAQTLIIGTTSIAAAFDGMTAAPLTLTIAPAALTSIALRPPNYSSVVQGLTQQFTATGTYTDGSTANLTNQVTWTSDVPVFALISDTGLVSALADGVTNIRATLGTVSSLYDTLIVTAPVLTSLALTPANPSVAAGLTQQFTVMGVYSDGSEEAVTDPVVWASSNASVAHISATGLATAAAIGTSTISVSDGSISGSTKLTVLSPALTSIVVSPVATSLAKGLTLQYHAEGVYTDGSQKDLTNSVTWKSSNPTSAPITAGGLGGGAALGRTTITASVGSIAGTTSLTITPAILTSILIQPTVPAISLGKTQQYNAIGVYSDGTQANINSSVTWATSNGTVASISPAGLVSGLSRGTTTISAKVGSLQQTATLTVAGTPPVLLGVTPVTTKSGTTSLVLSFNEALNSASVLNSANYSLLGGTKSGAPYNVPLAIASVTYNAKNNTVTIVLSKAYAGKILANILPGLTAQ